MRKLYNAIALWVCTQRVWLQDMVNIIGAIVGLGI